MKKSILILSLLLVFAGCSFEKTPYTPSTQKQAMVAQEDTQQRLIKSSPVPVITQSTTREALIKRTELFDANDKLTYIYLISYGKVMAFYTVQGQVVSLRSYLTQMENIVDEKGNLCVNGGKCHASSTSYNDIGYVVQAPDLDGTYGDNPDGIFFFTTEGAYVEWKGDYMVSDQPLQLTTTPELVRQL